jgi:hypothetical protein
MINKNATLFTDYEIIGSGSDQENIDKIIQIAKKENKKMNGKQIGVFLRGLSKESEIKRFLENVKFFSTEVSLEELQVCLSNVKTSNLKVAVVEQLAARLPSGLKYEQKERIVQNFGFNQDIEKVKAALAMF